MRLYITGIKNLSDAQKAVSLGASAVGIKMGYEKNLVHPELARDIYYSLPVFVSRVGIFADEKIYNVQELVTFCRLDTLHFIGNEQPEDIKKYPEHVLKTFEQKDLNKINDFDLQGVIMNLPLVLSRKIEPGILNNNPQLILCGDLLLTEWIEVVNRYHPYAVQLELNDKNMDIIGALLPLS